MANLFVGLVAAVILGASNGAHAQPDSKSMLGASGAVRGDYFSSSRSLDDRHNFLGISAEVKVTSDFSEEAGSVLQVRAGGYELGRSTQYEETRLLQGFVKFHDDVNTWRIGKQLIPWGRADAINPTDFFTAHDYRLMLPLEADQRLAATAVRFDRQFSSDGSVSVVAAPHFQPTRLPEPPVTPFTTEDREPASRWRNIQFGARINHEGEGVGWAVSGFRGFSTLPTIAPSPNSGAPFTRHYPRVNGIGGDVAHNFGRVGARAEIAYIKPVEDGYLPPDVSPYWYAVVGGDRGFQDRWNINLQLVARYATRYIDQSRYTDAAIQAAAMQNNIVYGIPRRSNFGTTSRVAARWWNDTLTTEVLAVIYFDPTNYLLRPMATYALTDTMKIIVGGEYYSGPETTFFGQLEKNRTAFVEVNFSF